VLVKVNSVLQVPLVCAMSLIPFSIISQRVLDPLGSSWDSRVDVHVRGHCLSCSSTYFDCQG